MPRFLGASYNYYQQVQKQIGVIFPLRLLFAVNVRCFRLYFPLLVLLITR